VYIDPSKTITAPYSQANELVFGQSSGKQCVAMTYCPLIYNDKQGINSANHLVSIMNIGNQLNSSLSQLTRQSFLMQTELLTLLNVFETDSTCFSSTFYTNYYAISLRVARVNASRHLVTREIVCCPCEWHLIAITNIHFAFVE